MRERKPANDWVLRILAALGFCLLPDCSDSHQHEPLQKANAAASVAREPVTFTASNAATIRATATIVPTRAEVPLEQDGGTFLIPVTINDAISLKFTIDSGASDVIIPSDVASTLVRAGTISADDYVGSQTFVLADGSEVPSPEFRIRSLRVGNVMLHNVVASITSTSGSLLLGQSFLRRLRTWSIDNSKHVLVLEALPDSDSSSFSSMTADRGTSWESPTTATENTASSTVSAAVLASTAQDTVKQYFAAWSDINDPDGQGVKQFYGDSVSYYGKQISLPELMSGDKLRFAKRWPVRSYNVVPDSMQARCTPSSMTCTVKGTVDWAVSSPARLKTSSGSARFSLILVNNRIVGEGGRVLSRN